MSIKLNIVWNILRYIGTYIACTLMGAMIFCFCGFISLLGMNGALGMSSGTRSIIETPLTTTFEILLLVCWGTIWLIVYPIGMFLEVESKNFKMSNRLSEFGALITIIFFILGWIIYFVIPYLY